MRVNRIALSSLAILFGIAGAFGQSSLIKIDLATTTREPLVSQADAAYNKLRDQFAKLTFKNRQTWAKARPNNKAPYLLPGVVRFMRNGSALPTGGQSRGPGLTLDFDPSFDTAFPGRTAFLQKVYDDAKPTIEAIFGDAAISGTVKVVNFDSQIGDRQAVVGGYYLPNNGSGAREIRLPLNSNSTVAGIALLHCILLAYLPDPTYGFDAYLEGIVRATTMKLCRTSAAVPTLDADIVAQVLENTYDVGDAYDWANQKSLGGPTFIAPNLLTTPVADGTFGGLFLTRYKMAGSTWAKVLVEYPTFAKNMNAALAANPSQAASASGLRSLAVSVLNAITPGGTIEGIPFAQWMQEQAILQTKLVQGTKLHTNITPITSGLAGTDFGVFVIEPTWFETSSTGNETLLSGVSYPVFWDQSYNRVLPSAQSERIDIAASYGSVTPNFGDFNAGRPYRIAVDIPVQDRITRQFVPAGAIATTAQPTPNDFYGTIVGVNVPTGNSLLVDLTYGSKTVSNIPVFGFAFGTRVNDTLFNPALQVTITVKRRDASNNVTTVFSRKVNKSVGALGVQLGAAPVQSTSLPTGLASGVQLIGFPHDPLDSDLADLFPAGTLAARYNPGKARYELYPSTGIATAGQGYFVRANTPSSPSYRARVEGADSLAIALRPGWNLISNPLSVSVPFSRVQVLKTTEFPRTYLGASGNDTSDTDAPILGKDLFAFTPGANDPVTGAPEGGAFTVASSFEPGVGYFVRCLAAEGAVILFGAPADSGRGISEAASKKFGVTLSQSKAVSRAAFGVSSAATNGFDSRLDSNLPPSFGGMQVSVLAPNGDARYSDIRPMATTGTYRLRASGLTVGSQYTLSIDQRTGRWVSATAVMVGTTRQWTSGQSRLSVTFVATKTTMDFDVSLRGIR